MLEKIGAATTVQAPVKGDVWSPERFGEVFGFEFVGGEFVKRVKGEKMCIR